MGTLVAMYVRHCSQALLDEAKAFLTPVKIISSGVYTAFELDDHSQFSIPAIEQLSHWSSNYKTEIIWIAFQSTAEVFYYHHWENGLLKRALAYADGEWHEAEGIPEKWEAEWFFNARALQDLIQDETDEEEKKQIVHIWDNHLLTPGAFYPIANSRETCRTIAEFYLLPGWRITEAETVIYTKSSTSLPNSPIKNTISEKPKKSTNPLVYFVFIIVVHLIARIIIPKLLN